MATSGGNGLQYDTRQFTDLYEPNMNQQRQERLLRNEDTMMVCVVLSTTPENTVGLILSIITTIYLFAINTCYDTCVSACMFYLYTLCTLLRERSTNNKLQLYVELY